MTTCGWRIHGNHRAETKAVKDALIKAGYTGIKVRHGTGTAWTWLNISANALPGQTWQNKRQAVIEITQSVTGRHGFYSGEISVD